MGRVTIMDSSSRLIHKNSCRGRGSAVENHQKMQLGCSALIFQRHAVQYLSQQLMLANTLLTNLTDFNMPITCNPNRF